MENASAAANKCMEMRSRFDIILISQYKQVNTYNGR